MTHIDLKDKTILLTGASNGIGRGVADYLMQMGGKVAVHYNRNKVAAEALVEKHQNGSKAFHADFCSAPASASPTCICEKSSKKRLASSITK